MIEGYKLSRSDMTALWDGKTQYKLREWTVHPAPNASLGLCSSGVLHLWGKLTSVLSYTGDVPLLTTRLFRCQAKDVLVPTDAEGKFGTSSIFPVEELPLAAGLGPQGEQVVALLRELPAFPWLRATGAQDDEAKSLVWQHLGRLKPFGYNHDLAPVVKPMTLIVARKITSDTTCAATWRAAKWAAREAAWITAKSNDRATAWEAVLEAPWDILSDVFRSINPGATLDSDASTVMDATYRIAEDLLPDKPNPFSPLTAIWRLGYYPVGPIGDEFVVAVIKQ